MTASLLWFTLSRITSMLAGGFVILQFTPSARAAIRHALLAGLLLSSVAVPIVSLVVPTFPIVLPYASARAIGTASDGWTGSEIPTPLPEVPQGVEQQSPARGLSITGVLLAVEAAGAVVVLVPLIAGLWQTRRLCASGQPWPRGKALVRQLAAEADVHRDVEVLLHEKVPGPVTCGVRHPAILLPTDAHCWDDVDLEHALIHELEHVRRRDWAIDVCARATCALYWFHPLIWMAYRQLRLESERAADDAVVRGGEAIGYAEFLVSQAQRLVTAKQQSQLIPLASRRDLPVRIESLLDASKRRERAGPLWTAAIALAGTLIVLSVSSVRAVSPRISQAAEAARAVAQGAAQAQSSSFDVASLKRNTSGGLDVEQWTFVSGRFTAVNVTLRMLLITAYGSPQPLPDYLMEGGPAWIDSARFDVIATTQSAAALPTLLRQLVEDRFRLRTHFQSRNMPIFALRLARADGKLGPGIRVNDSDCDGIAAGRASGAPCTGQIRPGLISGRGFTMERIASAIGRQASAVGRPVVDQTGIASRFDFVLTWVPVETTSGASSGTLALPTDTGGVSIFAALREQLGLKLEPARGAVDVLTIDSAELPTDN